MSDPFVAEIRMFPFWFPPKGWASCDGQLLPKTQNTALFALLGTTYGGNGISTFGLPDMQGAAGMQPGQGQGLSLRNLGEIGGVESVTLLPSEIPAHSHSLSLHDIDLGELNAAGPNRALAQSANATIYKNVSPNTQMAFQALPPAGGGLPHNNMQPYLTLNFCIAMQGVFPQHG